MTTTQYVSLYALGLDACLYIQVDEMKLTHRHKLVVAA
jgi:hypothetical protein